MKTRDELLIAQAAEDIGLSYREHPEGCDRLAQRAIELERAGCQPPTDPDLIEARKILAAEAECQGKYELQQGFLSGHLDNTANLFARAIKRGRELERDGE